MNIITLKEFCALHGRSYKGAIASGIPAALLDSGMARKVGKSRNSSLMVESGAKWPRRKWSKQAKKAD